MGDAPGTEAWTRGRATPESLLVPRRHSSTTGKQGRERASVPTRACPHPVCRPQGTTRPGVTEPSHLVRETPRQPCVGLLGLSSPQGLPWSPQLAESALLYVLRTRQLWEVGCLRSPPHPSPQFCLHLQLSTGQSYWSHFGVSLPLGRVQTLLKTGGCVQHGPRVCSPRLSPGVPAEQRSCLHGPTEPLRRPSV